MARVADRRGGRVAVAPRGALREIACAFAPLGWTAFGGPAAHVAPVPRNLRRAAAAWLTHGAFAELLALGQCLPGPTSTQMSFAIGIARGGVAGGVLSGALFQHPGLLMMALAGAGAAEALVNPSGSCERSRRGCRRRARG